MTVVRPHASSEAPHGTTPHEGRAPLPPVRVGSVIAAVALALGLLEILWLGVVLDAGLAVVDPLVTGWLASTRPQLLARVAGIVTTVGGPGPMSVLLAVAVAVLSWRRGTAWPVAVGAGGLAALTLIDLGVKVAVARPRPPEAWRAVAAAGWSFPSGHAMFAAGALLLMIWILRPRRAVLIALTCAAVTVAFLVGASRVVLGVHYPSDVLAGWCLGVITDGGVLLLVALVRHYMNRRPADAASGGSRSDRPSS